MAWKVTIAGVDKTAQVHISSGVSFSQPYNERWTARFTCVEDYVPALRSEVLIYDTNGTTLIFGGLVYRRAARAVNTKDGGYLFTDIECVDWSVYTDWRTVTGGYVGPATVITGSNGSNPKTITTATAHGLATGDAVSIIGHSVITTNGTFTATKTGDFTFTVPVAGAAGTGGQVQRLMTVTLKRVLEDAITYALGVYGITLDGAQVTGPTGASPGLSWTDKTIADVLRDLTILSGGYLWTISPAKVLSMKLPGGVAAPFTMTTAVPNFMDLSWDENNDNYATRIILHAGKDGTKAIAETFIVPSGVSSLITAVPAVADSGARAWNNAVAKTIGPLGGGTELIWTWQTHTITAGTFVPNVGDTLVIEFTAQMPFTVIADSGAGTIVERIFTAPDITEYDAAQDYADALLARHNQDPRNLTIKTRRTGLAPGQTLTVNVSKFQTNVSATITSVQADLDLDGAWIYTVQATTGTHQGGPLDYFRSLGGGAATALPVAFAGNIETTVIQQPPYAVLGGSSNTAIAANPAAWTDAVNRIPYFPTTSGTVRVRVDLWSRNAGVTARARLWDYTSSNTAGISSIITSQTPTETDFVATVIAGNRHVLQVLSGTNAEGVFVIGSVGPT